LSRLKKRRPRSKPDDGNSWGAKKGRRGKGRKAGMRWVPGKIKIKKIGESMSPRKKKKGGTKMERGAQIPDKRGEGTETEKKGSI